MKTFLIPTTFEADTRKALQLAMDMFTSSTDRIVLLSISEVSNSITDLLFLGSQKPVDLEKRQAILDHWAAVKKQNRNYGEITTHHQYGLSRSTFNAILERFNVSMSVVPESFQHSKQHIHQFMLKLLHQSQCPMMLLPANLPDKGIQRALYLDEVSESATVQGYPFHVIHKSMMSEAEYPSVQSMVEALNIDLIVKGKRVENTAIEINTFGLPVLAV
jgi:hypothetical protein